MSGRESDRLILTPPATGTMNTPPQSFFHHHHHHHHLQNQQVAVAEAGCCAAIVCCAQATTLCSEANDPSNSCMTRTCNGLGATACGIMGVACCFLSVLALFSDEKKDNGNGHHHHHGHH